MLVRWWRRREDGLARRPGDQRPRRADDRRSSPSSSATSNFFEGAWLVIVLVPILMVLLMGIHRHYRDIDRALALDHIPETEEVAPQADRDRADRAPRPSGAPGDRLRQLDQHRGGRGPRHERPGRGRRDARAMAGVGRLDRAGRGRVAVPRAHRSRCWPTWTRSSARRRTGRSLVVLTEFVPQHWWENLLHNQTALRLKLRLFTRPQHDRGGRAVPPVPRLRPRNARRTSV